MKHTAPWIIVGLLALAAEPAVIAPAVAAPLLWVADPMRRVMQDEPPSGPGEIVLNAARGEVVPFQVVVSARGEPLADASLSVSPLKGRKGGVIPAAGVTRYREHYVAITNSLGKGALNPPEPLGTYPDALIPFVNPATGKRLTGGKYTAIPFTVDPGKNQPIWVDVAVPRDAAPGLYTGKCIVRAGSWSASVPIRLNVWHFTLPKRPALRTAFAIWARKTARELLLQHRLMPGNLDGEDLEALDRKYGLNAIPTNEWSGATAASGKAKAAPAPEVFAKKEQEIPAHLRKYLYNYTADEITGIQSLFEPMKDWARNIHAQSSVKNLLVAVPDPGFFDDGTGRPVGDIFVVMPFQAYSAHNVSRFARAKELGCEIWTYNSTSMDDYSPKWIMNFAPVNWRIQPWINESNGYTGLLYWRVDRFTPEMWEKADWGGWPGDGQLIYPSDEVGIFYNAVPSLRLKYLREGVNDYDYIQLLKGLGDADYAMQVVRSVGASWKKWARDPADVEAAKLAIARRIEELTGAN
jgi:hypothetical protein